MSMIHSAQGMIHVSWCVEDLCPIGYHVFPLATNDNLDGDQETAADSQQARMSIAHQKGQVKS